MFCWIVLKRRIRIYFGFKMSYLKNWITNSSITLVQFRWNWDQFSFQSKSKYESFVKYKVENQASCQLGCEPARMGACASRFTNYSYKCKFRTKCINNYCTCSLKATCIKNGKRKVKKSSHNFKKIVEKAPGWRTLKNKKSKDVSKENEEKDYGNFDEEKPKKRKKKLKTLDHFEFF